MCTIQRLTLFITTLVCYIKPFETGLKPKSRLVALGFEEGCLSKSEKESRTAPKTIFVQFRIDNPE